GDHCLAVSTPAIPQPVDYRGVGVCCRNNSRRAVEAPCGTGLDGIAGSTTGAGSGRITGPLRLQLHITAVQSSSKITFGTFRIVQGLLESGVVVAPAGGQRL